MSKLRHKEVKYFAWGQSQGWKVESIETQVLNSIAATLGCSFLFSKSILIFSLSEAQHINQDYPRPSTMVSFPCLWLGHAWTRDSQFQPMRHKGKSTEGLLVKARFLASLPLHIILRVQCPELLQPSCDLETKKKMKRIWILDDAVKPP